MEEVTSPSMDPMPGPTPGGGTSVQVLATIALAYLLLGIYVEPPLFLGSTLVPAFTIVGALPFVLLGVSSQLRWADLEFLCGVAVVFLASVVLSPGSAYLAQKGLGIVQTMTSLVTGVVMVRLIGLVPRRTLDRVLMTAWSLILVGAALEVLGPLRPVVRSFGAVVYRAGGYGFYSADARDAVLTGFPRPVLFTSEPSLVAIGFMIMINSWLILRPSVRRLSIAVLSTLALFPLIGSLVLLLSLGASVGLFAILARRMRQSLLGGLVVVALAAGFTALVPAASGRLADRVQGALGQVRTLQSTSENVRLVFPAVTAVDVLTQAPAFGVGLSGKEAIGGLSSLPFDFITDVPLSNNLANLLIYLGLLGTAVFLWLWRRYLHRLGVRHMVAVLVPVLALSQSMGGFETPRFWGYVFLVVGTLRVAESASSRRPAATTLSKVST